MKAIDVLIKSMESLPFFKRMLTLHFSGSNGVVVCLAMSLLVCSFNADAVMISMRDTTFSATDSLSIELSVDSIPPIPGILSYQFVFTFDSSVLTGVSARASGTLSEPFGDPFNSGGLFPGELHLAAAGIHTISGSGPFVTLILYAVENSTATSAIRCQMALLNEGNPPVVYADTLCIVQAIGQSTAVGPKPLRIDQNLITLSPNPSKGDLTISSSSRPMDTNVRVWNILGQQVLVLQMKSATLRLQLDNLSNGIYLVTFDALPDIKQRIILLH